MSKTYAEKLRDPRWQKKRLQVMERAGFKCDDCGREDQPLNVHHRQYFKGREPWDYEDGQLACLCDECHAEAHSSTDELSWVSSFIPNDKRADCAAILAGYTGACDQEDGFCPWMTAIGDMSKAISRTRGFNIYLILDVIAALEPNDGGYVACLRSITPERSK